MFLKDLGYLCRILKYKKATIAREGGKYFLRLITIEKSNLYWICVLFDENCNS